MPQMVSVVRLSLLLANTARCVPCPFLRTLVSSEKDGTTAPIIIGIWTGRPQCPFLLFVPATNGSPYAPAFVTSVGSRGSSLPANWKDGNGLFTPGTQA